MLTRPLRRFPTPIRLLGVSATRHRLQTRPASTAAPSLDDLSNVQPRTEAQPAVPLELGEDRRTAYLYFNSVFPIRLGIWDIVRQQLSAIREHQQAH